GGRRGQPGRAPPPALPGARGRLAALVERRLDADRRAGRRRQPRLRLAAALAVHAAARGVGAAHADQPRQLDRRGDRARRDRPGVRWAVSAPPAPPWRCATRWAPATP